MQRPSKSSVESEAALLGAQLSTVSSMVSRRKAFMDRFEVFDMLLGLGVGELECVSSLRHKRQATG